MAVRLALIVTVAVMAIAPGLAAPAKWEKHEGCTLIANKANDGDSFHVMCNGKERIFRLCFVDCPETSRQIPTRIVEQADHWSMRASDVLKSGRAAAKATDKLLSDTFTVHTQWKDAGGKSSDPRYFAMIDVDGTFLSLQLVAAGHARAYGFLVDLPDGTSKWSYRHKLQSAEKKAKRGRKGAWRYQTKFKRR